MQLNHLFLFCPGTARQSSTQGKGGSGQDRTRGVGGSARLVLRCGCLYGDNWGSSSGWSNEEVAPLPCSWDPREGPVCALWIQVQMFKLWGVIEGPDLTFGASLGPSILHMQLQIGPTAGTGARVPRGGAGGQRLLPEQVKKQPPPLPSPSGLHTPAQHTPRARCSHPAQALFIPSTLSALKPICLFLKAEHGTRAARTLKSSSRDLHMHVPCTVHVRLQRRRVHL